MFQVSDITPDLETIFGKSSAGTASLYRHVNDAIDVLVNGGDWDPHLVYLDICCPADGVLALPSWVETVFSVNIDGRPSQGRDRFYEAHLNGPGVEHSPVGYSWLDKGRHATMVDVSTPKALVAHVEVAADAAVAAVRVFGWDENNVRLKTLEGDAYTDGYLLPTVAGFAVPPAQTVKPARIERIVKAETQGRVRVASIDWQSDGSSGELLADLEGYDRFGWFPRIRVGIRGAKWLRLMVRRKNIRVSHPSHWIPLSPRLALVEMLRALRKYQNSDVGLGTQHEANARRFLAEREKRITPPTTGMPQVSMEGGLTDGLDHLDA